MKESQDEFFPNFVQQWFTFFIFAIGRDIIF